MLGNIDFVDNIKNWYFINNNNNPPYSIIGRHNGRYVHNEQLLDITKIILIYQLDAV